MRKPPLSAVLSATGRRLGGARLGGASSDFGTPSLTGAATQRAPPLVPIAALVVFRSEGIETMGQFVCGQYANPAEIDRRVGGPVEERRLNEAGGDVQAIHRSDIAGLQRCGRRVPFLGVHRLAQFA